MGLTAFSLVALYAFASFSHLFVYLKRRYGHSTVHDLNRLLKLNGKRVRVREHIAYLRKCLESFVTPPHIKHRVIKTKPKHSWAIERAFLRDEIDKNMDFLQQTTNEYHLSLPGTLRQLSFFDRLRYCKLLSHNAARMCYQIRTKKGKTLEWLLHSQVGQGSLDHSTIINLAGIDLSELQKDVLCRGLSFGVPPKVDSVAVEAEFELFWQQLDRSGTTTDEKRRECQAAMADFGKKYISLSRKPDRTGYPLKGHHLKVISDLRKDKDIVISRPDKGNGVVLLRRNDYLEKMETILSQPGKFLRIGPAEQHDTTLQQERALQAYLYRREREGHISRETYERIRPIGATRPRMYGLPKIHKEGAPLRPIVSMVNAPQHEMAKWLNEILKPVLDKFSEHTVRDSFEFCSNLDDFAAKHGTACVFMCSFDIQSLFTNIPLVETIEICLDTLYRDETICAPSIPEEHLRKMLMKATAEVEFSFNDVLYRQIDGVAMGSPLGPILANIFVGYCESRLEKTHWPLFYNRFVDDTFAIFNDEDESLDFFGLLNNVHPDLRFTVEGEVSDRLPFMDVLVRRDDQAFTRSVYRKPTYTGLLTRWDSFAPPGQKIGLIKSLTFRALRICSKGMLEQELAFLRTIFVKNGYPTHVIDKFVKETVAKHSQENVSVGSDDPDVRWVVLRLPWLGNASNRLKKEITAVITRCYAQVSPRVTFTSQHAFNGRAKDVLPTSLRSMIVYKFTCSCGLTYVGKTSQCLSARAKQHVPVKLLERKTNLSKTAADSAVTRHLKDSPECIQPTPLCQFHVLAQARTKSHLDVLEALFIQRLSPPLCAQKSHVRALSLYVH